MEKNHHENISDSDLRKMIGIPLHESLGPYFPDNKKLWEAIQDFRIYYSEKGVFESHLYEGIFDLLTALKDKSNLHLLTAKPTEFAQKILEHHHVDTFFSEVFGCKTDGSAFSKSTVLKEFNTSGVSIMIGDKKEDIVAGKENNFTTGAVLYGYGTIDEIDSIQPDHIFKTVGELTNFFCD